MKARATKTQKFKEKLINKKIAENTGTVKIIEIKNTEKELIKRREYIVMYCKKFAKQNHTTLVKSLREIRNLHEEKEMIAELRWLLRMCFFLKRGEARFLSGYELSKLFRYIKENEN